MGKDISSFIPNNQKLCSLCGQAWREGQRPFCSLCGLLNILYRKHGTGQPEGAQMVSREIRYGRMVPPTNFACVDCGAPATAYEHRDYNKPLDVVPTCRPCNAKRRYAIPLQMTYAEFLARARKSWQWAQWKLTDEAFEPIRRKYWPNEQQEGETK
jgi:hypothetical protein